MCMAVVRIVRGSSGRYYLEIGGEVEGEERAKEEVLHDGELVEDFAFVHLDHALVDFIPCLHLDDRRSVSTCVQNIIGTHC